ncbi:MAG TPA: ABC transporter ATP-binding protein [Vicinamibacterales bacterium]|nr:ABC transporter ATP-binding protein [Vicinamibacterales bacterium]
MNAIEVVNVTKIYRRYARRKQFATLKSALLSGSLIQDLQPDETFPALQGVSFNVPAGKTYGVIGRNGSGKSTALKLVAGITKPTTGSVSVRGRISALIELGAGFHPEISGRENVFINGIMLGLTKREVARRFDEIVEFADMQEFIDAPVKTYSSGMYMRLGFAVAIHVDPDVLLVDEVLAVGDEGFTHKCLDKFGEFKRRGKTILLVTHALSLVERFCDEALWLDGGKVRGAGDPKRVVGAYLIDVERSEERELAKAEARAHDLTDGSPEEDVRRAGPIGPAAGSTEQDPAYTPEAALAEEPSYVEDMTRAVEGRWGSREIEITGVILKGESGEVSHIFQSGERVSIHLAVRAHEPNNDFVFGIGLYSADGVTCYGTNTQLEDYKSDEISGDGEVALNIESLDLVEGTYKLDVAVHKRDGYPYDYHRLLYTFRVKTRTKEVGIYRPRHTWTFSPTVKLKKI